MLIKKSNILGVIPARSGSKRIPNKNITEINGVPLLEYTVRQANDSKAIKSTLLSTDSADYARFARGNVVCPELRPSKLADDGTSDLELILYLVQSTWFTNFKSVSHIVYLRPTSPIRSVGLIDRCIQQAQKYDCSVRSCNILDSHSHPFWSLKLKPDGFLEPFFDMKQYNMRSQLLPEAYTPNGCVDVIKVASIEQDNLYGKRVIPFKMLHEESIDIDNISDLKRAEQIFRKGME